MLMTFFPKSAWRYAVLIIILFAIVAVTSAFIISYLEELMRDARYEQTIQVVSFAIWALTLGVMFLAGALGLWAIRSTAEIESRRRIGRFVNAMDYLRDGLVVLDRKGRITAFNPAVNKLAPYLIPERGPITLGELFPSLLPQDSMALLESGPPCEIERNIVSPLGLRTLRFRSQPSSGVQLVLISDVTNLRTEEIRKRQVAQLQLIGRIAGGMAHDFNNILCAIDGHAALLKRQDLDPAMAARSLEIIADETRKGSVLSRQLLELGRAGAPGKPCDRLGETVAEAADLLKVALSPAWTVKTMITGGGPAVPLSIVQVEQIVLNLGLQAADAQAQPGTIMISLDIPGQQHLRDVGNQFAAVILVSVEGSGIPTGLPPADTLYKEVSLDDVSGVISSVVGSLVAEAHGRLDYLTAPGGMCVYRVCLPHLALPYENQREGHPAQDLTAMVAHWSVLLAGADQKLDRLDQRLCQTGCVVARKDTVVALLSSVESLRNLDAVVLEKQLLGEEAESLLKAMVKICPRVGIVVLCPDPLQESAALSSLIVFESAGATPEKIIRALITARTLAAGRKATRPGAAGSAPLVS